MTTKKVTKKAAAKKKAAKKTVRKKKTTGTVRKAAKKVSPKKLAAPAAAKPSGDTSRVTEAQIRARAFEIYRTGRNPGNPDADWLEAERELSLEAGA